MLVERIDKESPDLSRIVADMGWWLDENESITDILSTELLQGMWGWSEAPYPPPNSLPPYDPTPVVMISATLDATQRQLIVFVEFGTPGLAYTLRFVLLGTSSRKVTIELGVQITGVPPEEPMPLPNPPSQAAGSGPGEQYLNIKGGIMQGPLYLFGDPKYPTEAVTKHYVDGMSFAAGPFMPEAGGTFTGPVVMGDTLTLAPEDPIDPLEAASKQYVDGAVANIVTPYLPLVGGTLTGPLLLAADPTDVLGAVTKQYVDGGIAAGVTSWNTRTGAVTLTLADITGAGGAPINSPVFTGVPTAPTPPAGTSNLQLATTAFVAAAVVASTAGVATFNTRSGAVALTQADVIAVLAPGTPLPIMAGVASAGTAATWSRSDHVHPVDSVSLAKYLPLTGGALTGPGNLTIAGTLGVTGAATVGALAATSATISGTAAVGGGGIIYPGVSGAHYHAFNWTGTAVQAYVDGSLIGNLVTQASLSGAYLPIGGGTVTGALTVNGLLTANGDIGANARFYINSSGAQFSSDANYTYLIQDGGNWHWRYARSSGLMQYVRGNDYAVLFTIDGAGNISAPGQLSCTQVVVSTGTFAIASNYYMGRSGADGHWRWVEAGTTNMELGNDGVLNARGGMTAPFITGTTSVRASPDGTFQMYVVSGGTPRRLAFANGWSWDWDGNNGDLTWWADQSGPFIYFRTADKASINWLGPMYASSYQYISDERLKAEIEPAKVGLAEVLALNPIRFRRKSYDGSINDAREIGFSAQQIKALMPEAATAVGTPTPDMPGSLDSDEPMLAYSPNTILAALVNAVKDLQAQITNLGGTHG